MSASGHNWAGNVAYRASDVVRPDSVAEVARVLRSASSARAVGTRHSFTRIADTGGIQVSVEELRRVVEIDVDARVARVSAGMRYGDVAEELQYSGWALANLASLPHISVAGAIATGTHGSGDRVGSLAAAVRGLELVSPDGSVHTLRRGEPGFDGAVVSLGALGVVTAVEVDIEPTYDVAQTVYPAVAWDAVLADLDAVTAAASSTSMFTTWRSRDTVDQVWLKSRLDGGAPPAELLGAAPAVEPWHPIPGVSPENCTEQLGVPGPWLDRLPHFRLGFTPSRGDELQSEYLVPREHAVAALTGLRDLAPRLAELVQVCEIRTVAADTLWLSMMHETDAVGLHFTWVPDQPAVEAFLPTLEVVLAPLGARPHWGKLFATTAERLRELYPRFADFEALRRQFDPRGVLLNDELRRLGFGV